MFKNIARLIEQRLTNQSVKTQPKKMEQKQLYQMQSDGTFVLAETLDGSIKTGRIESPEMAGGKMIAIQLVLDYTAGEAAMGNCSVCLGDTSDMFKALNPNLSVMNAALKIGGDYGIETLNILNKLGIGHNFRFHQIQGSANKKQFWTNKKPVTLYQGTLGENPSSRPYDLQMTIGPEALNLEERLDDKFRFTSSPITAAQFLIKPTESVTYTFILNSLAIDGIMSFQ